MNPNTTHHFNVAEAEKYGIEPAILLTNIRFWLDHNKANKKNIHDGFAWTYNSSAAFSELFPYMKERSISRNLKTLCDAGILQSGCFNKMKYDRTLWYTIPSEFAVNSPQAASLAICQNGEWNNQNTQPLQPAPLVDSEIETPPQAASLAICQNGEWARQNGEPIPDINTDIKPDINKRIITTVNSDFLSFDGLTAEQAECYEWAKHHDYWNFTAGNLHKFLKLFTSEKADGLKSQLF